MECSYQWGFTIAMQNPTDNIWIGETGILVALTALLISLLVGRTWKAAPT